MDKPTGILKKFLSFPGTDDFIRRDSFRRAPLSKRSSFRNSLCNRRTVGAVTYSLDGKIFTQKLRNNFLSTPDIWRHIKEITSGIQTQPVRSYILFRHYEQYNYESNESKVYSKDINNSTYM